MIVPANVVSATDEAYCLSDAILLYRRRHGSSINNGSGEVVFASVHEVNTKDTKPVIEAGVAISKSGLIEMFKTLTPEDFVKPSLLESHILARGNNHLAWFSRPQKRRMWFKGSYISETNAVTDHPGLVFIILSGRWHVFAVKSKSRPTSKTPLYVAPYFNVWAGGHICVGNIDTPKGESKFSTGAWEESFFRSYFTHPNQHTDKLITKHRGGVVALWRALLKGKAFNSESLVPIGKTLGQVFDELVAKAETGVS